jgi:transcriptional regulator with XRE-family HTH domain
MKARNQIRLLRKQIGYTQEDFAKLVGVSFVTVNRWENGVSQPSRLAWQKILELEENPPEKKVAS